jgi:hypothetical protein
MKDKNKIYFYIALFLLLTLLYFNFNFNFITFKEGAAFTGPAPPAPTGWTFQDDKTYAGTTISTTSTKPSDCLTNCTNNTGCIGIVYDSNNSICNLKSSGTPTTTTTLSGFFSYFKPSSTATGSGSSGSGSSGSGSTRSGSTGSGSTGSGSNPSCSSILNDVLQNEKDTRDATAQYIKEEQEYIYDQAKIFSAPAIAQLNVNTGIINSLRKEYDDLFKKMTQEQNEANNARIQQLQLDASKNSYDLLKNTELLKSQINDYEKSIETKQTKLDSIKRQLEIQEAIDNQEKKDDIKYDELHNSINNEITHKIGGYTPQNTLQKTMRDICDNVISSIGDTTKVLTDKMGNFVGPDGLLSKFNGFTNDNSLYNSIDKIDSNVTEQDIILKNILYTLKYYTEIDDKVDTSNNSYNNPDKPIPYQANSLLQIDTNRYCVSDYDAKLGDPLCCGRTGVLSENNKKDKCGPSAKWCVKVENKQHGFCSPNKPTNNET